MRPTGPASVSVGALPGVVAELCRSGALPADAPGLRELVAELDPAWATFTVVGDRIDQAGWPASHDVAIAHCAAARVGAASVAARAALDEVGAWLVGDVDRAALEARRRCVFAAALGAELGARGTRAEDAIAVLSALRADPSDAERAALLDALGAPLGDRVAWLVAAAARAAADGWLAYDAHRGYPSSTAVRAAEPIRLAIAAGVARADDVVAWARALLRAAPLAAEAVGGTTPGAGRAENLDAYLVDDALGLYLVVDGQVDRRATAAALPAFVEGLRAARARGAHVGALRDAALAAHEALRAHAAGTIAELAAAWLTPEGARVCSVGAARCHHARRDGVVLLTTDDVLSQNVVSLAPWPAPGPDGGDLDAWDPRPRVLGGDHGPRVCEVAAEVVPGDLLLLSTDGLTWLEDDEARVTRALVDGRGAPLGRLLDAILPRPGESDDDATALVVRVERRGAGGVPRELVGRAR